MSKISGVFGCFFACLLGISLSSVCYFPQPVVLLVLILFPVICFRLGSRWMVLLFCISYLITATWFLPKDYAHFFSPVDISKGIFLYLITLLILSLPWFLFYPSPRLSFWRRVMLISLAILVVALPPFGLFMPGSFLLSMGYLYPNLGWLGVALFFALLLALLCLGEKELQQKYIYVALIMLSTISFVANIMYQAPAMPSRWVALDTWAQKDEKTSYLERAKNNIAQVREQMQQGYRVIILPEAALGVFGKRTQKSWGPLLAEARQGHVSIIAGGEAVYPLTKNNYGYYIIESGGVHFKFNRQSMPYSNWLPWHPEFNSPNWFGQTNFVLDKKNVQVSVCYEDFVPWLQLWPFAQRQRPEILVTLNNLDFAGYRLRMLQHKTVYGFARLFAVPLLEATNYSSVIKKT